jgi:hypothetical protein
MNGPRTSARSTHTSTRTLNPSSLIGRALRWLAGYARARRAVDDGRILALRAALLDEADRHAERMMRHYAGEIAAIASPRPAPPPTDNLLAARRELALTPQEEALYWRHLANLVGPGGVDLPDGSRATLLQITVTFDGTTYNLPTVCDGRIVSRCDAIIRAVNQGLSRFPAYASVAEAEARYALMHAFMARDVARARSRSFPQPQPKE